MFASKTFMFFQSDTFGQVAASSKTRSIVVTHEQQKARFQRVRQVLDKLENTRQLIFNCLPNNLHIKLITEYTFLDQKSSLVIACELVLDISITELVSLL